MRIYAVGASRAIPCRAYACIHAGTCVWSWISHGEGKARERMAVCNKAERCERRGWEGTVQGGVHGRQPLSRVFQVVMNQQAACVSTYIHAMRCMLLQRRLSVVSSSDSCVLAHLQPTAPWLIQYACLPQDGTLLSPASQFGFATLCFYAGLFPTQPVCPRHMPCTTLRAGRALARCVKRHVAAWPRTPCPTTRRSSAPSWAPSSAG